MPEEAAVWCYGGKTLVYCLPPSLDVTDARNVAVVRLNTAAIGGISRFPQFGGQLDFVSPVGEMTVTDDVPIVGAWIDVVVAASDDEQKNFAGDKRDAQLRARDVDADRRGGFLFTRAKLRI